MQKLRRPLSILLSLIMIFSVFTVIPITASAEDDVDRVPELIEESDGALPVLSAAKNDLSGTGASYKIAVGDRLVNDSNCSDVYGDGRVIYNPSTKVLTLNEPIITSTYENNDNLGAIQIQTDGVTVRGGYTMSSAISQYGLKVSDGNHVTLEGNFTFSGKHIGVLANSLTVNSGSVTAVSSGTQASACAIYSENFAVNSGITMVEMQAPYCVFIGDKLTMNGARLDDDALFLADERAILNSDMRNYATHAVIRKFTGTYYDLWLGSRHVDSLNCTDIYGDGKASFDPSTNTLTLNEPDIVGAHTYADSTLENNEKIYTGYDLTIRGSYHTESFPLLYSGTSPFGRTYLQTGVYSTKSLTLDGDFSFTAKDKAVYGAAGVTVSSGSLKAVSTTDCAVYSSSGAFTVNNGVVTVDMQGGQYTALAKSIVLGDRMTISYPEIGIIMKADDTYYTFGFANSQKVYRAVIGKMPEYPSDLGLDGSGTESAPYLIKNADEWNKIANFIIKYGGDTTGAYFKLMNDITVTTTIGTRSDPFAGVFDGNGKTLTLNLFKGDKNEYCVAPFSYVSGVTIKDLKVEGSVHAGYHCSGLIGAVNGGENLVENVEVSAEIDSQFTYCGGFIGHGGTAQTTLRGCAFNGSFTAQVVGKQTATIYGWSDAGSKAILENCIDLSNIEYPLGRGAAEVTIINTYYTRMDKLTAGELSWGYVGQYAYTVGGSDVELTLSGSPGLTYNGTIYAARGEIIHLIASDPGVLYSSNYGTLVQNGSDLILTMTNDNITVYPSGRSFYSDYSDAASDVGYEGETADKLFDGDTDTMWRGSNADTTPVVTFSTGKGFIPSGYVLCTASDTAANPSRNPISWTLEGSPDGKRWIVLTDVIENFTLGAENGKAYVFSLDVSQTTAYMYFRFTINALNGGTTFQLSELQLIGKDASYVGETYNLWLGSTQVSFENMDDILNDGKAQFDPATCTLTLNDPVIEDYYVNKWRDTAKIYSDNLDLTIKGSYHMTDYDVDSGVHVYSGWLTLDGDFTFIGNSRGIHCNGNHLTFASGTVYAASKNNNAIHSLTGMTIKNEVRRIEAVTESDHAAVYVYNNRYGGIQIGDRMFISLPENGVNYNDPKRVSATICNPDLSAAAHAVIERIKHTVTFDTNGHGTAPDSREVTDRDPASEPEAPTETGWTFGGWYTDKDCTAAYDFSAEVTEDLTLYAKWTQNEYDVTFDMNGHGTAPEKQTVKYGETASEPEAPTETGWTFGGWFTDKECTKAYDFSAEVTGDLTLYAKWTQNEYKVTFDANGGTGEMQSVTVKYGEEFILPECTFTPPADCVFERWDKGAPGEKIIVTADITVKAVWKDVPFILGDGDGDGEVTILDATAIQRFLANLPNKAFHARPADADGDGEISILDATAIQRYLAAILTDTDIGTKTV